MKTSTQKTLFALLISAALFTTPVMAMDNSLNAGPPGIDGSGEIGGGSSGTVSGRIVNSDIKGVYHGGIAGSGFGRFKVSYPYLYKYTNRWTRICNISSGKCTNKTPSSYFSYDEWELRATGVEERNYRRNNYVSSFAEFTTLTGWTK